VGSSVGKAQRTFRWSIPPLHWWNEAPVTGDL
jgi:hypothetical protein